jgi:ABC-type multidrug transport system ATPase subunit
VEAPLLVAEGLEFRYREPVLRGFSLVVAAGRMVFLAGSNGAGKSTALALLAGEFRPFDGVVRVAGLDPLQPRARAQLMALQEHPQRMDWLSAREAVQFHRDVYGLGSKDGVSALDALARLGLADVRDRRIKTFSKGMARRVELAALLAADRPLWLLDEPEAGLDPEGRFLLADLLCEARARGCALVLAAHSVGPLLANADELVVLNRGRTVWRGTVAAAARETGALALEAQLGSAAAHDELLQAVQHLPFAAPTLSESGLRRLMERQP